MRAKGFRKTRADFVAAGAVVIGGSADSMTAHCTFADKHQFPFAPLADSERSLRRLFHVADMPAFDALLLQTRQEQRYMAEAAIVEIN